MSREMKLKLETLGAWISSLRLLKLKATAPALHKTTALAVVVMVSHPEKTKPPPPQKLEMLQTPVVAPPTRKLKLLQQQGKRKLKLLQQQGKQSSPLQLVHVEAASCYCCFSLGSTAYPRMQTSRVDRKSVV